MSLARPFKGDNIHYSSTWVLQLKVREADDSIKPGVERSGTPGSIFESKPAERPTADSSRLTFDILAAIGRFAGSAVFGVDDPGVSLRSTPGFMLSSAPRTFNWSTHVDELSILLPLKRFFDSLSVLKHRAEATV
jgi:hypothetical protein